MLRRWATLFFLLLIAQIAERPAISLNWKAVAPQDLKVTAMELGCPEADAAILFREGELIDNDAEGTSLKVYVRMKIFTERGRKHADIQLPYKSELGKITDVRARTIRPDNSIVNVESRDIFDRILSKNTRGTYRAKVFSMPAVEPGSIIEYRYRQTYPEGFRFFALDLQSDLFTKELRYSIKPQAETSFDVRWVTFNAPDAKKFDPVWDGTYDINAENIPPFRREALMPPDLTVKIWGWLYYSNEFETAPEKYWREYAQRMYERTTYETKPTKTIRRVIEAITLPSYTTEEKIARLYHYLQNEIRNTGEREIKPAGEPPEDSLKRNDTAEQTLKRRYGTPREINRLFVAMLRTIGLDARVAELTTRDENFFHQTFPDAFQFNSEVTVVINRDGTLQFYDPSTPYCPVGMLSWDKEAVEALIHDARNPRFVKTSLSDASQSKEEKKVEVKLFADGRADVKVEAKVKGQRAIELRNELIDLSPDERRKHVADKVRAALAVATVEEEAIALPKLTTLTALPEMAYDFSAPLASRSGSRLLFRPALVGRQDVSLFTEANRSNRVYFKYPWSETERVAIQLPAGFEVEQLPEGENFDIGVARYLTSFTRDGQRVIFERKLSVDGFIFSVEHYASIKTFFDRVQQADRTAISFRQPEVSSIGQQAR